MLLKKFKSAAKDNPFLKNSNNGISMKLEMVFALLKAQCLMIKIKNYKMN